MPQLPAPLLAALVPAAKRIAELPTTANLLGSLCSLLLLSLLAGSLAWFLQTAMGPGMIFRPYKRLIFGLWWKGRPRRSIAQLFPKGRATIHLPALGLITESECEPGSYRLTAYQPAKWWRVLYKPLGGCIYCNAPWLLMPYHFGLCCLLGWPWWLALAALPLTVGGQYATVELLNDYAK